MNPPPKKRQGAPIIFSLLVIVAIVVAYAGWRHLRSEHSHAHAHAYVHEHDHDGHGVAVLSLDNGKRWETDQPLRTGMERLREAVVPALLAYQERSLTPPQAKALAATVRTNVNDLIQNCKLEPKADAVLHALITELMEGAATVEANPEADEGVPKLANALREYPEYFDHAGWVPLPAPEP